MYELAEQNINILLIYCGNYVYEDVVETFRIL